MTIWQQLQSRAAHWADRLNDPADLPRWLNSVCSDLNDALPSLRDYRETGIAVESGRIAALLCLPDDEQRAILDALNQRTAGCIVLVRVWMDERRAVYQASHPATVRDGRSAIHLAASTAAAHPNPDTSLEGLWATTPVWATTPADGTPETPDVTDLMQITYPSQTESDE